MKNLIDRLLNLLNGIGKDKYQHFTAGAAIAALTVLAALPLDAWWRGLPLLVSMIAVVTAAVLKERRIDPETDLNDILWTLGGGAAVWAAMICVLLSDPVAV